MGGETLPDLLSDPTAVHLNMLRGGIAKPSPVNIWHLYGRALLDAMPQEYRAAVLDDGWRPIAGADRDGQHIALLVDGKVTAGYWSARVERWILLTGRYGSPTQFAALPAPPPPDRSEG